MSVEHTPRAGYVTGAAGDIGRAIAIRMAQSGCSVLVADLDEQRGAETVRMVEDAGGQGMFCRTDVSNEADVSAMVAATRAAFGRLDFGINNAGIPPKFVTLDELPKVDWDHNLRVNLTGTFLCMKHAIRTLLEQGQGGTLVNISSVGAIKSVPLSHVYSAAKRGLLALTANAAVEYARRGIRVNAISPGYITGRLAAFTESADPAMTAPYKAAIPAGEFGLPTDIADAAYWLCSNAARYVNGHNLVVDGGMTA
ncbi:MAG TPA: SDR family oxidoreductase [Macromonas sp.]|nr:SDR family oxidoreductase [Macromonas sp.]